MRLLLAFFSLLFAGTAGAQTLTACDWEAAHPSDPYHVGPGVSSKAVDTVRAIAACEQAVKDDPAEPRFHYQLGRALVYHADRKGSDWRVGLPHLEKAADGGHVQAQFVLGLMYQREGDACAAAKTMKQAADAGLKAARIGYGNDFLAGRLDGCEDVATAEEVDAYLAAAGGQVGGWYEQMLLEALRRELAAIRGGER
jgi:TPR repeat protein